MWGSNHNCHHHHQEHHPSYGGYPHGCSHHSGQGSGVVGMLAAEASYGAHRIAHGHGHGGYAHGGCGGYYRHKHGIFRHGKFGRHGKFKKWK